MGICASSEALQRVPTAAERLNEQIDVVCEIISTGEKVSVQVRRGDVASTVKGLATAKSDDKFLKDDLVLSFGGVELEDDATMDAHEVDDGAVMRVVLDSARGAQAREIRFRTVVNEILEMHPHLKRSDLLHSELGADWHLQRWDLARLGITALPDSFKELHVAKDLYLFGNKFRSGDAPDAPPVARLDLGLNLNAKTEWDANREPALRQIKSMLAKAQLPPSTLPASHPLLNPTQDPWPLRILRIDSSERLDIPQNRMC